MWRRLPLAGGYGMMVIPAAAALPPLAVSGPLYSPLLPPILIFIILALLGVIAYLLSKLASARGAAVLDARRQEHDLEEKRRTIRDLLRNVAVSVSERIEQESRHAEQIEGHRTTIRESRTISGLREVARLLLDELDLMQAESDAYRAELAEARDVISRQQKTLEEFQADLHIDALTRIANRRAFDSRIAQEFERARRYGDPCSLVMFDIDFFKKLNDAHGHVAGDKVLQAVAKVVNEPIRKIDMVARYGGEEFVIILPRTPAEKGYIVAERARKAIEALGVEFEGKILKVTISLGLGEYREDDRTPQDFISRVDAALYRAKGLGRNRVERA